MTSSLILDSNLLKKYKKKLGKDLSKMEGFSYDENGPSSNMSGFHYRGDHFKEDGEIMEDNHAQINTSGRVKDDFLFRKKNTGQEISMPRKIVKRSKGLNQS